MIKPYLYAAIVAVLLLTHWWAYNHGKDIVEARANKAALEFRDKENKLIADLQAAQAKTEIIYRDRIKIIKEVVDATPCNCLDAPIDPTVLEQLRKSNSR